MAPPTFTGLEKLGIGLSGKIPFGATTPFSAVNLLKAGFGRETQASKDQAIIIMRSALPLLKNQINALKGVQGGQGVVQLLTDTMDELNRRSQLPEGQNHGAIIGFTDTLKNVTTFVQDQISPVPESFRGKSSLFGPGRSSKTFRKMEALGAGSLTKTNSFLDIVTGKAPEVRPSSRLGRGKVNRDRLRKAGTPLLGIPKGGARGFIGVQDTPIPGFKKGKRRGPGFTREKGFVPVDLLDKDLIAQRISQIDTGSLAEKFGATQSTGLPLVRTQNGGLTASIPNLSSGAGSNALSTVRQRLLATKSGSSFT